jgi:polyisoprenoid-binding protein YceI
MHRGRSGERGGIISFLMFAVVIVVAAGVAGWWFFVRSDAAPPPEIKDTNVVAGGTLDGTWTVRPGEASFVQYRVKEQFVGAVESDATGRTDDVTATMTINGTTIAGVNVSADLSTLTSDKDRRDRAIHGSGLQSDQFPTATFVLTQPITLPQAPQKGVKVTTDATGDLTLHGITKLVTIPLEGRWDGQTVQVVGELPIRFVDYGITPPNIGGFVTVAGEGKMELQLFFAKG